MGQGTPTTAPAQGPRKFYWKPTGRLQTIPWQHRRAHHDFNDILHDNGTTHFLCGWSNTTSTQSTTFHTLTAPAPSRMCPPFHLCRLPPGWWREHVKVKGHVRWEHVHQMTGQQAKENATPNIHSTGTSGVARGGRGFGASLINYSVYANLPYTVQETPSS